MPTEYMLILPNNCRKILYFQGPRGQMPTDQCREIDDEHQINTHAIAEKHNKFWPLQWNVLAAAKFV